MFSEKYSITSLVPPHPPPPPPPPPKDSFPLLAVWKKKKCGESLGTRLFACGESLGTRLFACGESLGTRLVAGEPGNEASLQASQMELYIGMYVDLCILLCRL